MAKHFFSFVLAVLLVAGFNVGTAPAQVPEIDSLALVALYNSTNGDNWTNNTNWLSSNPVSTWYGVTVSGGGVVSLDIHQNGFSDAIPPEALVTLKMKNLDRGQNS